MEITMVKEENRSYFLPLAPGELWGTADFVLGAIESGTACGVLAVKEEDDAFVILHLYVAEEFCRQGIAAELLNTLHSLGRETGADYTRCSYVRQPGLEPLFRTLEACGFELDAECSPVYSVQLSQLPETLFAAVPSDHGSVIPLADSTARYWNQLLAGMEEGLEQGAPAVSLRAMRAYDQKASVLSMKDGACGGCLLMTKGANGYSLDYLCVLKQASPIDMMAMFQASYQELTRRGEDVVIYINALTETTEKMVDQMTRKQAVRLGEAVTQYYLY